MKYFTKLQLLFILVHLETVSHDETELKDGERDQTVPLSTKVKHQYFQVYLSGAEEQ